MEKTIEKIAGLTVKSVKDTSNEFTESYKLEFTSGDVLEISGCASGSEIEYDGLFCEWKPAETKENPLKDLLRELSKSYEYYSAIHKPESEWDEYDYMMYPIWLKVKEILDTN